MSKSKLITLVAASLVVFSLASVLLAYFFLPYQLHEILIYPGGWWQNMIAGILMGLVTGFLGWWLVTRAFMHPVQAFFQDIFQNLNLNWFHILFISFCAGIGEELLFRGVIQHWLGIWWTALLFVAIHGYLNPANWRLSVFGVFMVLAVAVFGYSTQQLGLLSAIVAHVLVDVVLLYKLSWVAIPRADIPPE